MKKLFIAAVLSAVCAFGAEVSGKWAGTADAKSSDGSTNTESVYFTFKQDGAIVTGTASGPNEAHSVEKGKVEGNTLTFELAPEGRGVFKVKLTVDGDNMTGDVIREGEGGAIVAKLLLKREK
jgi:hypothetical protein